MSLLIKGMELPEKIDPELVIEFADGITGKRYARLHHYQIGSLTDWFEAVPIPPHVDLIDRNKIFEAFVEEGQKSKRYKIGERWELNGEEIRHVIANLPDVIPKDMDCGNCN